MAKNFAGSGMDGGTAEGLSARPTSAGRLVGWDGSGLCVSPVIECSEWTKPAAMARFSQRV